MNMTPDDMIRESRKNTPSEESEKASYKKGWIAGNLNGLNFALQQIKIIEDSIHTVIAGAREII